MTEEEMKLALHFMVTMNLSKTPPLHLEVNKKLPILLNQGNKGKNMMATNECVAVSSQTFDKPTKKPTYLQVSHASFIRISNGHIFLIYTTCYV